MESHYHILNGDSLKEQFPKELTGQIIVARECLIDGEVKRANLEDFYRIRAQFINEFYGDYSIEEYYTETVSELEKIRKIPESSSVYLWFEDDLFCQVNFWFVAYLLFNFVKDSNIFLIRPKNHTQYGFGGLNKLELLQVFEDKVQIDDMNKIASLWKSYQNNDLEKLINTAKELQESFPFIFNAVEAHLARIPSEDNPGKPIQSLLEIMGELGTEDFAPVFREFNKREAIYGFGDLQVKRLFDGIENNH